MTGSFAAVSSAPFERRTFASGVERKNGEPHPVTGSKVILTTAHVFDDRPEAANFLNLAALCQKCHNAHDATARQQRRRARLEAESGQTTITL